MNIPDVHRPIQTMLTGNTETFITVTYQSEDNTIDFVVPIADGFTTTGTINASAGKVRICDDAASKPTEEGDGYISVYESGSTRRLYTFVGGVRYYITLTADPEAVPGVGNPIGLLLVLTYAA